MEHEGFADRSRSRKMTKNKVGLVLAFSLGSLVVLGCSKIFDSNKIVSNTSNATPATNAVQKEWRSYDIEKTDIKVDFPAAPTDRTPPLPPSYREIFSAMNIWSYDAKDFTASATELVPTGSRNWKIKDLADTSMTALKKQAPDLKYDLDIKSETNTKLTGTFTRGGKPFQLRGCCIYKKDAPSRVWAILTIYAESNADGESTSQRIIDSAVFKNSTERCN